MVSCHKGSSTNSSLSLENQVLFSLVKNFKPPVSPLLFVQRLISPNVIPSLRHSIRGECPVVKFSKDPGA